MPGLLRQTVAVAGRAGQRIGRAAGAQQHRAACDRAVRGQNAVYRAVRDRKARHRRLPPLDAAALQRALQHVQNIGGAVRDGKHAVAALDLERAAALLKKGHCRFRREGRHGAVEEAPVARNIFQRLFGGAGICDIAAALAGDEELFAAAAVFFEQEELKTMPFGEIWAEYCRRCGVPEDGAWLPLVRAYEKNVLEARA